MTNITIVGGGVQGTRMAGKYKKFPSARLRAVVSPHKLKGETFVGVPFFVSAVQWKKRFGRPTVHDVFDISVHQPVLISVLQEFAGIGAKNFILPKPIALTAKELATIEALQKHYALKIVVASQWHYAAMLAEFRDFINKNKKSISSVSTNFSAQFDAVRQKKYTAHSAFLPHALQILIDAKLVTKKSLLHIEYSTDTKIQISYSGAHPIHIESDIAAQAKKEILEVYRTGSRKPYCVIDFAGVKNATGFVRYPSITVAGKKKEIHEDILEKMVEKQLTYFQKDHSTNVLTLKAYLPVAQELVRIAEKSIRPVAVIGGGIFGSMAAIEIASQGHPVVLFEKEPDLLRGASLVNQCRVHMGYHYPRDTKTAGDSNRAKKHFEKTFGSAIYTGLSNHYLVAKEGSLTSSKEYVAFCKKMGLPYSVAWPKGVSIAKNKIALSLKVPEPSFDANTVRHIIYKRLKELPNVSVITSADVSGITRSDKDFDIEYKKDGARNLIKCSSVINATYSGANYINRMIGLPLNNYQYELCEMPVVHTPWRGVGWSIVDGPFFGAMPFGFSKKYLFYDVGLSVLERSIGILPQFKHNTAYYRTPAKERARFKQYQKKWSAFVPDIYKSKYLYSIYVVRAVLPKQEKTDARPTIIDEIAPGFWQIFSGKITTSVPMTKILAKNVTKFLRRNAKAH